MSTKATILFAVLAICCFSVLAAAQTAMVVADNVPNNGPIYYGHERNVARTDDGSLFVAWQDNATAGQIVFSSFDAAFNSWSPPAPISAAAGEADLVGMVSDGVNVHATWQQRDSSADKWQVFHARYHNGAWSTPVKVSQNDTLSSEEPTIEALSTGDIIIVYNTDSEDDGDQWILSHVSADQGQTWSIPDTASSPDGVIDGTSITSARVRMYPGSNGRLAASWHENAPRREREIHTNQFDGSSWLGELVASDTTAIVTRNWYPNLVVDSQDNLHLIYSGDQNGAGTRTILHVTKGWDDPAWSTASDTIAGEPNDFLTQAMTIDANDILYVGYRRSIPEDTLGLEEVVYTVSEDGGTTWSMPVTLSRPNYDAGYLVFAARVVGDGVDAVWRESSAPNVDDADTTAILYAKLPLGTPVSVEEELDGNVPKSFVLQENYPNPFNPTTTITYSLPTSESVTLSIHNILGQEIRMLLKEVVQTTGNQTIQWDGKDNAGEFAASGVYFYRLKAGDNFVQTRKMLLLK